MSAFAHRWCSVSVPRISRGSSNSPYGYHTKGSLTIVHFSSDILGEQITNEISDSRSGCLNSQWSLLLSSMEPTEKSGDWTKPLVPWLGRGDVYRLRLYLWFLLIRLMSNRLTGSMPSLCAILPRRSQYSVHVIASMLCESSGGKGEEKNLGGIY